MRVASFRPVQHLAFWGLSFYVLLRIFSTDSETRGVDYIYDALFHLTLVPAVYFNLVVLMPALLSRQRYLWYLAAVGATVVGFSQLNIWFFDHLVDFLLPGYYFISYYEWKDILQFFLIYLAATTLLKLSKGWFQLSETRSRLAETEREKLDAELEALKSQVNPHFLFNSLNNLYGLALKNDKQTPASILKLSEVMRYMIYEAAGETVALARELDFIENYVNLQRLRSDSRATISLEVEGEPGQLQIAPLLFIPFVENSFKHGIKGETGKSYVHILFRVGAGEVTFSIRNNKGAVDDVEHRQYGGIGLANVKKRLELIYTGNYDLQISDGDNEYAVGLTIRLS